MFVFCYLNELTLTCALRRDVSYECLISLYEMLKFLILCKILLAFCFKPQHITTH
ncbi:hypothetical protein HanRHA438_Chr14g0673921 [Helianthus annuus]|nr:hypothetical protein HanRHA438_Chr14g0673921 [Helianthus annuus]